MPKLAEPTGTTPRLFARMHRLAHCDAVIGILGPNLSVAGTDCFNLNVPDVGHNFDQTLACFTRRERDGVANHIGLAAGPGVRGFGGARGIIVTNHHVLGLHTHLVGGDLRQHGENALADLGNAGHNFRAAAVIEFGPRSRTVDHGSTRNAVPAGSHSSSAFAGHALLRRFLFLHRRKARTQCARRPDIVAIEIAPFFAAGNRSTCLPAGRFLQCVERPRQAD